MKWNALCRLVAVYPQIIVRSHLNSAKALAIIALPSVPADMAPKKMVTQYESTWGSGEPDAAPWRRSQEKLQQKSSARADAEETSVARDAAEMKKLDGQGEVRVLLLHVAEDIGILQWLDGFAQLGGGHPP